MGSFHRLDEFEDERRLFKGDAEVVAGWGKVEVGGSEALFLLFVCPGDEGVYLVLMEKAPVNRLRGL